MPSDLEYVETDGPREVTVAPSELRALRRARHGLFLEELGNERIRLGPRTGYAGTVLLPTGRRVVVRSKAEVHSLPDLLALAYRTMAPPASAGSTTVKDSNPTEWLLLQLAGEVNDLLSRGLRRGYVDRRETLPFVRGRTRPPLNPAQLPFLDCQYSDFTADTTENQLLRGVLELFAPAAQNRFVRRQMADALAAFADVTRVRPSVVQFDRVQLTRLNQHYAPSLRLARLALEGAGVTDGAGSHIAPAYFVPMWRVWETATAAALRAAGIGDVTEQPEYSDRFTLVHGPKRTIGLRPDIVIGRRNAPRYVVDLKWTPALAVHHGRKRLRNEHIYQLATYCTALDCDGMILYPQMDESVDSSYEFNGRTIALRTVDLSLPHLAALHAISAELAAHTSVPA
ncbi:MAG: McrC family protein [Sporichthyaceae bacterium]